MRTSFWLLSVIVRSLLRADTAGRVCLRGVLVQGVFVAGVQVGSDIENDFLDRPRKRERRLVRVPSVDDEPVVATDVHPGIATKSERNRVLDPAAAHALAVDEERNLARRRGLRCVRSEYQFDVD